MAGVASQRTAIVTGASSGIGLYTALGLARAGMRVVMIGRDRTRTEAARQFVLARAGAAPIAVALADFAALAEVRRLAEELLAGHDRLDLLINNAGLFSPRYRVSADGFELTFAVNHLAPFLLTNLLLDRLKTCAPARIINVASEAHRRHRLDPGFFTPSASAGSQDWTMMKAYGRSKLCNILFTRELAARLQRSGVTTMCLHPGVVATAIGQRGGLAELGWRLLKPFMLSAEKGAETSLFLATLADPAPFHGGYVIRKALTQPYPAARDGSLARRLWAASERFVAAAGAGPLSLRHPPG